MAIKKIPCGGWLYDDEQITFEDGVMKVVGGGSGGGATVVHFEIQTSEESTISADKTPAEVMSAALTGLVVGVATVTNEYEEEPITMALGSMAVTPTQMPAFLLMGISGNLPAYFIYADEDNWVVTFG